MKKFTSEYFSKDYFFGRKNSNYPNYDYYDNSLFWKSIISKVERYRISGRVLDAGCAFGFLLKRLEHCFTELYGCDISKYTIERARKEIPTAKLKVLDIDVEELPYPDEYFDLITALDVLEHTQSIENNLNKIVKKIKKGGYMIITVPIKDSWAGKLFSYFDKDSSHVSILPKKEIINAIERAGLKIIEKSYFMNLMFLKLRFIPLDMELLLQKK